VLANDHIVIELGGEFITLRPSLRCGLRLERREGSFAKLIADLHDDSLSAAHFVLADAFRRPTILDCIMDAGLQSVCEQLAIHAINCAGLDDDAKPDASDKPSEPADDDVTFADHLMGLYRLATGWLGWTPDVALDCTPTEIREAYKGRLEMLKAIFGGGDETDKPTGKPKSADDYKRVFREMGAKPVKRKAA
jgi:hypothetical protein